MAQATTDEGWEFHAPVCDSGVPEEQLQRHVEKLHGLLSSGCGDAGTRSRVLTVLADLHCAQAEYGKALELLHLLESEYEGGLFRERVAFTVAVCLERQGDSSQARERYRALLSEFPDSRWGADARAALGMLGPG